MLVRDRSSHRSRSSAGRYSRPRSPSVQVTTRNSSPSSSVSLSMVAPNSSSRRPSASCCRRLLPDPPESHESVTTRRAVSRAFCVGEGGAARATQRLPVRRRTAHRQRQPHLVAARAHDRPGTRPTLRRARALFSNRRDSWALVGHKLGNSTRRRTRVVQPCRKTSRRPSGRGGRRYGASHGLVPRGLHGSICFDGTGAGAGGAARVGRVAYGSRGRTRRGLFRATEQSTPEAGGLSRCGNPVSRHAGRGQAGGRQQARHESATRE